MYYDLLAKLKNATMAKKEKITVPFSKMDEAVLKALVENGYVKSADIEVVGEKNVIVIRLAYKNKAAVINDFKIVSKPSRRFYFDYRSLRPVKQGYGVAVLSTSKGIMTNKVAKKNKTGGEYLFEIW
jgi:small subunit ribosomal protein S8